MPTIEGPVTIKAGEPIPEKVAKYVKLPFEATGWKSSKGMEFIPEAYKVRTVKALSKKRGSRKRATSK